MKNAIIAILITVIAGLLLKVFEDRVSTVLSSEPIIASAVVGPSIEENPPSDEEGEQSEFEKFSSIIKLNVFNRSSKETGKIKDQI